jgi:hypothetical protein
MPMLFPDMESLRFCAEVWKFRPPAEGESEADYRSALAAHVEPKDFIEAHEIRTSRGHHEWNPEDSADLIRRVQLRNTPGGRRQVHHRGFAVGRRNRSRRN